MDVFVNGNLVPFSMKIGDAGEAFFVFETDDDVPDDLVTSPLLAATKPGETNARPEPTGRFGAKTSDESPSGDASQEPDFLDLDGSASGEPAAGPSSLPIPQPVSEPLPDQAGHHDSDSSASSSILSRTADIGKAIVNKASDVTQLEKDKFRNETFKEAAQELEKEEGTYIKNSLASARNSASEYLPFGSQKGDEALPATSPVEGPDVRYTHGTHAISCRVSSAYCGHCRHGFRHGRLPCADAWSGTI